MRGVIRDAIRIYLQGEDGPRTWKAIAAAIGMPDNQRVRSTICQMSRDGQLSHKPQGYVIDKLPRAPKYASEAEKIEARRIRERNRKRAKHGYKARPAKIVKVLEVAPVAAPTRVQTVDEFVAEGGEIEVLPSFQTLPYKSLGWHDQGIASYAERIAT